MPANKPPLCRYDVSSQRDINRAEGLVKRLPAWFQEEWEKKEKFFGDQKNPSAFRVFEFAQPPELEQQSVTHVNMLIELVARLYRDEFGDGIEKDNLTLGKMIRERIRICFNDQDQNASEILGRDFTHPDYVAPTPPIRLGDPAQPERHNDVEVELDRLTPAPVRNAARIRSPTPYALDDNVNKVKTELSLLSALVTKSAWAPADKLDLNNPSISKWRRKLAVDLMPIANAMSILTGSTVTNDVADGLLRTLVFKTFGEQLVLQYTREDLQTALPTASSLFQWAVEQCTAHSHTRRFELEGEIPNMRWGGDEEPAKFLGRWVRKVDDLQDYLPQSWPAAQKYQSLRHALCGKGHGLFVSIFTAMDKSMRVNPGTEFTANDFQEVLTDAHQVANNVKGMTLGRQTGVAVDESALAALQASGVFGCWACGGHGHPATRCPDKDAKARFKRTGVKATIKPFEAMFIRPAAPESDNSDDSGEEDAAPK